MNERTGWIRRHQIVAFFLVEIALCFGTLFPWLDRLSHTPATQVRWRDTLTAIGLGAAILVIQSVFFNDPTVAAR